MPGTADKFFSSHSELHLLRIKYETLAKGTDGDGQESKGELKWEEVGRGCFAHYYGADLGKGNVESALKVQKEGSWVESLKLAW